MFIDEFGKSRRNANIFLTQSPICIMVPCSSVRGLTCITFCMEREGAKKCRQKLNRFRNRESNFCGRDIWKPPFGVKADDDAGAMG